LPGGICGLVVKGPTADLYWWGVNPARTHHQKWEKKGGEWRTTKRNQASKKETKKERNKERNKERKKERKKVRKKERKKKRKKETKKERRKESERGFQSEEGSPGVMKGEEQERWGWMGGRRCDTLWEECVYEWKGVTGCCSSHALCCGQHVDGSCAANAARAPTRFWDTAQQASKPQKSE